MMMMVDRCMTGSVAEFVLTPIFHHHRRPHRQSPGAGGASFACHVQPLAGYALYDLHVSVLHRGDVIRDVTLTSRRLVTPNSRHPYRTVDRCAGYCALPICSGGSTGIDSLGSDDHPVRLLSPHKTANYLIYNFA